MELFSEEVKDLQELKERLKNEKSMPGEYKVAVIAFVFDKENQLILQRRGPACRDERFKLEGIGGGVKATDANFRTALQREIVEEVGENAVIKIENFMVALGEKTFDLRENKEKYWVLLAYKGKLERGELQIAEPDKNLGYERYKIGEVNEDELSVAARKFYEIMKERLMKGEEKMNLDYEFANNWLQKLKEYWMNKDVERATSLFTKTTFYQETPFMKPYTTFEQIQKEWQHIKEQDIKKIEFTILAIESNTMIVEWLFERDIKIFNGIYQIKFNTDLECVYFRSWEMEESK